MRAKGNDFWGYSGGILLQVCTVYRPRARFSQGSKETCCVECGGFGGAGIQLANRVGGGERGCVLAASEGVAEAEAMVLTPTPHLVQSGAAGRWWVRLS